MKKAFILLALLTSAINFSQNLNRIEVTGNIIVESADISGITVYNKTLKEGTITNENGEFTLNVKLNDEIEVSAVQYKNINFKVNNDIIESKSIKIFLIEEINKLDEIIVSSSTALTGNLSADLKKIKPYEPKLDVLYFGIKNNTRSQIDYTSKVENIAVGEQNMPNLVNGLNVVNVVDQLLLPLFRSEVKNKKKSGVPDVPVQSIKYYFGSEFLVDNFDIPAHRVEEFIRYVEAEDFDFSLLNYGKEMEFLQLLSEKSKAFLNN